MSVRTGLKFVRYDHINCSMRLSGHGKNVATSIILFPQIIFVNIEKHILEFLLYLMCFLFRHFQRGWFSVFVASYYRAICYEYGREKKKSFIAIPWICQKGNKVIWGVLKSICIFPTEFSEVHFRTVSFYKEEDCSN